MYCGRENHQTTEQGCVWCWLQVKVRGCGLGPRPIGNKPALSATQKRCCNCNMRFVALYKCYVHLRLFSHYTLCRRSVVVVSGVTFNTTKSSTPQLPLLTFTTRSLRRRRFAPTEDVVAELDADAAAATDS